jgi:hypothetical protein
MVNRQDEGQLTRDHGRDRSEALLHFEQLGFGDPRPLGELLMAEALGRSCD